MRTFDLALIQRGTDQYAASITGFNPRTWIDNQDNIALTNEHGDIALFECELPGVYTGHYFFHSRGKRAVAVAKEFLREVFSNYSVEVVRGLTPLQNLGARWMNRQLKLKSYGVVQSNVGPLELVITTKQEWTT